MNYLIYSHDELSEGLFGMVLLFILEILPVLENFKIDVSNFKWDISTKSYGHIFPNILKYKSEYVDPATISSKISIFDLRKLKPNQGFEDLKSIHLNRNGPDSPYVLGDNFVELNKLFFKYFEIPENLNEIANSYHLEDFLGLHFRGTDKTKDIYMNNPIYVEQFLKIVDEYININGVKKIFIASDDQSIYQFIINKYKNIHILTSRDLTGNLFWRNHQDKEKNAKEAMIDMLCLSKCQTVLKVSSALSSFSKLVNPNLKIYRINALKMFTDIPYFPDAYIPLLPIDERFSDECKNIIKTVQKFDWSFSHQPKFNNFTIKPR